MTGVTDEAINPELMRYWQEKAADAATAPPPVETPDIAEELPPLQGRHASWRRANEKRIRMIELLAHNLTVKEACAELGISYSTYASWRERIKGFKEKADAAKLRAERRDGQHWDGSIGSFNAHFFGEPPTWFQLRALDEMEHMPRGNILMVLWPPGFGKTSTFENHASRKLALDPSWRFLVGCESREIAQRILGKVMDRMNPMGPTPAYVDRFGPFIPQGGASMRQLWSDTRFRVHKARHSDQRDYSMRALSVGSKQTVSSRTDHFHLDDIQSTTTLNLTPKIVRWIRQDVFSRAGEEGITTIFGTRVDDGDALEELLDDPNLDESIMKTIILPAIYTDPVDNTVKSLWPERWPLEALERQIAKVGQEAFDRNYLQKPGANTKGRGTFSKDAVEPCQDPAISLMHRAPAGSILYLTLDPSIGGRNCVMALQPTHDQRLIVRRIVEDTDLKSNAQIANVVDGVITFTEADGAMATDLVIEAMAFQKGLMHDESILELRKNHGIALRDHLTGWNKYDDSIGVASMVKDFNEKRIVLPWAADDYTRFMIGELKRQLYAWKPGKRGNVLRQDMVMCLWFGWIMWRERWKKPGEGKRNQSGFQAQGLPYAPTRSGLLVPTGR